MAKQSKDKSETVESTEITQSLDAAEVEAVDLLGAPEDSGPEVSPDDANPTAEPTEPEAPPVAAEVSPTEAQCLRILRAPTEALEKVFPTLEGEFRARVAEELGRRRNPEPIDVLEVTKECLRLTGDGFRTKVSVGALYDLQEEPCLVRDGVEFKRAKAVLREDSVGRVTLAVV